jgi:hypothetical protein
LVLRATSILALAAVSGCALQVKPFTGTVIALDIGGADTALLPTQHVEMWGRNANDDIIRISYLIDQGLPDQDEQYGLQLRQAVDATDPCMINDTGYLLTDARAYPTSVVQAGVAQSPEQQAAQMMLRIRQVTSVAVGGLQPSSLLVTMPFDPTPRPAIAADAAPDARKQACNDYWGKGRYVYTGNPAELPEPVHGVSLGAITYVTTSPSASYSEITITSPYDLSNLEEVWFTLEYVPPAEVNPFSRGPVWLRSVPDPNMGRSFLTFQLTGDDGRYGSVAFLIQNPASAF